MYNYDNLSKYKVFLCVAECGSISQSAEQLYISQPAVSMTIKSWNNFVFTKTERCCSDRKRQTSL